MRDLINIVENLNGSVTVYHGGPEFVRRPRSPFFVTTSYAMAETYARERSADGKGVITRFDLRPGRMADSFAIIDAARTLGISDDELQHEPIHVWVSPHITRRADDVLDYLEYEGYNGAEFLDTGMDDPFSEFQAYCLIDVELLSNPSVVEVDTGAAQQGN